MHIANIFWPKNRNYFLLQFLLICFLSLFAVSVSAFGNKEYHPIINIDTSLISINGKILDENTGRPISGANIIEKNTGNGVLSDPAGNYSIKIQSNGILIVSSIGYIPKEITVKEDTELDIFLRLKTSSLDEVIVVGYGTEKKVNLSGAIEQISGSFLEDRPISNVGAGLQGALANLNITIPSGQVTSTPNFNIRGYTSINGGTPLIIVDDIPTEPSEFIRINPADIENITVLKDAASAAIYGARAAFGVILVTTKSGKSSVVKVSVHSNFGMKTITRRPEVVTDPYKIAYYRDIMAAPWYDLYSEKELEEIKKISENPRLERVVLDPQNPENYKYYGSTDWFKLVYNNSAPYYLNNISISQQGDKAGYYLSGEYFRQEGMFKFNNDKYDRYNVRGKVNYKIVDWLRISNNTAITSNVYDEPIDNGWLYFHNINREPGLSVPYNPDGSYTEAGADLLGSIKEGGRHRYRSNDILTTFRGEVDLLKDVLKLTGDASFRRANRVDHSFDYPLEYKIGPEVTRSQSGNSYTSNSSGETRYNVFNVFATYNQQFGKHAISGVAGYNQEERIQENFSTRKDKLISNGLPSIQLATGETTSSASGYEWAVRGYFFRLNYIFDERYIFETNGRYDGSSRFPEKDRFAFNPSASFAWVVSKESFFRSLKNVANLAKVRFSYGSLGNQALSSYYPYIPSLSTARTSAILENEQPIRVSAPGLVSSQFTWEKVTTLNVGLDASFIGGKLTWTIDSYKRETKGMLTKGRTLPSVLGTSVPNENAADLETKGWETSVSFRDKIALLSKDFNFKIRFVLADSRSYITKFDNPTNYLGDYYVGQEIGEIWGLTTEGFFQSNEEVAHHADQREVASYPGTRPVQAGDVKFKDVNGDNIISEGSWTLDDHGDYKIIGNSRNRYSYGIDLELDWKGFDLRAFLQGVGKRDWYPGPGTHYFWGVYAQPWASLTTFNLDHWTPDNRDAYFPRPKSYTAEVRKELGIPQTRYLQNAAYMRMKNLTVGYTLQSEKIRGIKISNLRFYLSGENLFEFTKLMKYLDPENPDGRDYPFQRTYSLGLNLSF